MFNELLIYSDDSYIFIAYHDKTKPDGSFNQIKSQDHRIINRSFCPTRVSRLKL